MCFIISVIITNIICTYMLVEWVYLFVLVICSLRNRLASLPAGRPPGQAATGSIPTGQPKKEHRNHNNDNHHY